MPRTPFLPPAMRAAAVVLAGGRAERLGGVNKALIELGGRPLAAHLHDALAGCDPRLLAVGRNGYELAGLTSIADPATPYAGPLAGVAAAVEALGDGPVTHLLSVAVDTPFFPRDFLARAGERIGARDVVLAAYAGQDYPTNALWRLAALRDLPRLMREGTAPHSLRRLSAGLDCLRLDYAQELAEDPFLNVNTPADLAAARARWARENPGA
ncbi:MAG TPA: molybdenum cofactor guanylyltransferase [Devosia sp.]|nr:molybdenum cofactor guanylyltransferase [Devosia sp.]